MKVSGAVILLLIIGGAATVAYIAKGGGTPPTEKRVFITVNKEPDIGGLPVNPNNPKATAPDPVAVPPAGKGPETTAPGGKVPEPPKKDPEPKTGPPVGPASRVVLKGSGSTFIKPAMEYWTDLYEKKAGVKIEYIGNGSGSGVENMLQTVTDFGCTDAYMSDALLEKAKNKTGEVVHVPLAMGAVVVAYNLDVRDKLKFSGEVLVNIYLGKITKWNDPAIGACNPGVTLPDEPITVMRRGDSSGTTAIWTEYLNKVNPQWAVKAGKPGNKADWPVGVDAETSDGMAQAVSRKSGAIGYVELSVALQRDLQYGLVRNKAERYVLPTLASVEAAANGLLQDIKDDLRYSLTNAPGAESYPIVGTTWLVLYADQTAAKEKGRELVKFLKWAVTDGQTYLKDLKYAKLPEKLAERVKKQIDTVLTAR
jgi:phosphate transport system substrate-binding protein